MNESRTCCENAGWLDELPATHGTARTVRNIALIRFDGPRVPVRAQTLGLRVIACDPFVREALEHVSRSPSP